MRRQRPINFARSEPYACPQSMPDVLWSLVPDFEQRPEWQAALRGPDAARWTGQTHEVANMRHAVGVAIVRKLRTRVVRDQIAQGDPFWSTLALNVIATPYRWHQSTRIKLNAMSALVRLIDRDGMREEGRDRLRQAIGSAMLFSIDTGVGEEFRAMTRIARRLASPKFAADLKLRAEQAAERAIRINAQRMLDVVEGRPYRRYGVDVKECAP